MVEVDHDLRDERERVADRRAGLERHRLQPPGERLGAIRVAGVQVHRDGADALRRAGHEAVPDELLAGERGPLEALGLLPRPLLGEDGEDVALGGRRPRQPLGRGLEPAGEPRRGLQPVAPEDAEDRLELQPLLARVLAEPVELGEQHVGCLGVAGRVVVRGGERDREVDRRRLAQRLGEVLGGGGLERRQLGLAQLAQHGGPLARGRRLGQRAPQRRGGLGRGALGQRLARGVAQAADRPRVAVAGVGGEEVRDDPRGRRAHAVQQPRGAAVQQPGAGGRQRTDGGVAQQRVAQAAPVGGVEQVRLGERGRRRGARARVQPGEGAGRARRVVLAEQRERLGEHAGVGRDAREAVEQELLDPRRQGGRDLAGVRVVGRDVRGAQLLGQLAHEQRAAARPRGARADERRPRLVPQDLREHLGDPVGRQRLGPQGAGAEQRVERRVPGGPALVAHAEEHRHRQALQARREVGEEAQRRLVGPLGVVDDEREGPGRGQAGDEPVQAVQRAVQVAGAGLGGAGLEDGQRVAGGAGQERGALVGGQRGDGRLEQRAGRAEREPALERRARGHEDARPVLRGAGRRGAQQRALADAGRARHDEHAAAGDRLAQRRELRLALHDHAGHRHEHAARAKDVPSKRSGCDPDAAAGERAQDRRMIDITQDIKDIAVRSMRIMADGTYEDFVEVVHPEAVNHEAKDEPPATRGRGPAAFYATALWLRDAFADLDFEVHAIVAEGDLVVVHNTMTGVHARAFVGYKADGTVDQAFPPTGRPFASTQTHWLRVRDGQVVEHWANRDDMGTAIQLGWIPPSPAYLVRMARATRQARKDNGE